MIWERGSPPDVDSGPFRLPSVWPGSKYIHSTRNAEERSAPERQSSIIPPEISKSAAQIRESGPFVLIAQAIQ